MAEALKAAQFYDGEEEEDFDYDEEVDLTAFEFDETVLEQGWTPSETPQLPSRQVSLFYAKTIFKSNKKQAIIVQCLSKIIYLTKSHLS